MQARVLIVDDDPDILTSLTKRLTWIGHDVLTAEDGEQALRMVVEDQPDVVLLDIELPGLGGLDILKRLAEKRSNVPAPTLPEVIVITAFGTIGRAVEAMRLGACDFLSKPFEPDHLSRDRKGRGTGGHHTAGRSSPSGSARTLCVYCGAEPADGAALGDGTTRRRLLGHRALAG